MTLPLQAPAISVPLEVTDSLAAALMEAAKLPVEDQNFLALRLMEEIAEEKKWSDSFARSLNMLDMLAEEARQDVAEGRASPLEDIL